MKARDEYETKAGKAENRMYNNTFGNAYHATVRAVESGVREYLLVTTVACFAEAVGEATGDVVDDALFIGLGS